MPSASRLSALVVRLHASGEVDDVGEPCCVKKFGGLFAPSPAAAQHDRALFAVEFGDSFGEVAEWDVHGSADDAVGEFFGLANVDELRVAVDDGAVVGDRVIFRYVTITNPPACQPTPLRYRSPAPGCTAAWRAHYPWHRCCSQPRT